MIIVNQKLWQEAPQDVKRICHEVMAGPLARVLLKYPNDHPKHPGYRFGWAGPDKGKAETVATNLDSWL